MPDLSVHSTAIAPKRYRAKMPSAITPCVFELEVYRGNTPEVHTFTARPKTDLGPLIQLNALMDDPMKMGAKALQVIARMMDDTDGTPSDWEPVAVAKPRNAGASYEPKFRGPDGKLHAMSDRGRFLAIEAGSSRRRWQHIVLEDDGVSVDIEVLMEIMTDLIEQASGQRPTPA